MRTLPRGIPSGRCPASSRTANRAAAAALQHRAPDTGWLPVHLHQMYFIHPLHLPAACTLASLHAHTCRDTLWTTPASPHAHLAKPPPHHLTPPCLPTYHVFRTVCLEQTARPLSRPPQFNLQKQPQAFPLLQPHLMRCLSRSPPVAVVVVIYVPLCLCVSRQRPLQADWRGTSRTTSSMWSQSAIPAAAFLAARRRSRRPATASPSAGVCGRSVSASWPSLSSAL